MLQRFKVIDSIFLILTLESKIIRIIKYWSVSLCKIIMLLSINGCLELAGGPARRWTNLILGKSMGFTLKRKWVRMTFSRILKFWESLGFQLENKTKILSRLLEEYLVVVCVCFNKMAHLSETEIYVHFRNHIHPYSFPSHRNFR